MESQLDIVIPVYNEGENIVAVLRGLSREIKTPARALICYDQPDDDTLPAVRVASTNGATLGGVNEFLPPDAFLAELSRIRDASSTVTR